MNKKDRGNEIETLVIAVKGIVIKYEYNKRLVPTLTKGRKYLDTLIFRVSFIRRVEYQMYNKVRT